jgi:hypothetical protein
MIKIKAKKNFEVIKSAAILYISGFNILSGGTML